MGVVISEKYFATHLATEGVKSGLKQRVSPSLSKNLYSSLEDVVPISFEKTSKYSNVGV